jgi:hypothetical protein
MADLSPWHVVPPHSLLCSNFPRNISKNLSAGGPFRFVIAIALCRPSFSGIFECAAFDSAQPRKAMTVQAESLPEVTEPVQVVGVRVDGTRVVISKHESRGVAEKAVHLMEHAGGYSILQIEPRQKPSPKS